MRRLPILALALALPLPALAAETIPGPIQADVVRIIDGDTITVDAEPWPGLTIRVGVRVDGIDTPELRGQCDEEKTLAVRARDRVRELVGATVELRNVRQGKIARRIVADVYVDGQRLADVLIAEGLARPYDGGRRESWCE
jgi:endonuclease YncB( thermonuclease family)